MKVFQLIYACLLLSLVSAAAVAQTAGVLPNRTAPAVFDGRSFAAIKNYFHQKVDSGQLAGTVILLSQGEKQWRDVYGKQDVENGKPLSEKTIFRLASMTKPIVSVAAMMLIEQGKLRLEDPLKKFIPAFGQVRVLNDAGQYEELQRSINVFNLLTHTSGISNNFFRNTPAEKIYAETFQEKHPASLQELVDILATLPLAHHPGEKWTYGYSTDVLARVVEIISGTPIAVFLEENIFQPLKMEDTGFRVPQEKLHRLAVAYGKALKVQDPGDGNSRYANGQNFPRGAGGLASTAEDYLRFCKMLLNGGKLDGTRLLKSETVKKMMSNQLPSGMFPHSPGMPPICNGFGLGFGVQTSDPVFGTPGDCAWPGAYLTYFFIDPTHKSIGILMTQSTDFSNLPMLGEFHQMSGVAVKSM